jgi:hypothetical protein
VVKILGKPSSLKWMDSSLVKMLVITAGLRLFRIRKLAQMFDLLNSWNALSSRNDFSGLVPMNTRQFKDIKHDKRTTQVLYQNELKIGLFIAPRPSNSTESKDDSEPLPLGLPIAIPLDSSSTFIAPSKICSTGAGLGLFAAKDSQQYNHLKIRRTRHLRRQ